ncbi:malonyl-CoA decarboxylase [Sphingomonas sp. AOB5]|uniref:malonyl-CoA decarboxylase n=1 Tax=Sphingomonas sp. AOB5 TaxID=3034017 RepID=UPI0023F6AB6D|nr:malonyl-CoA decarboxylase [Sphingomonas sp. AOB5]MDF7774864.1 malonyl-CoA decarboxylase [Sphingomonas sp. AOB5]
MSEVLSFLSRQGQRWIGRSPDLLRLIGLRQSPTRKPPFEALASALLSRRGEASGIAIARELLALYEACDDAERLAFFNMLADRFDPDPAALEQAWQAYHQEGRAKLPALAAAVESPRQELFRRLNLPPGGTVALVRMRADLIRHLKAANGALDGVDSDLAHLLQSWFNRGFLQMQRIDWRSPALLLERVIQYEAVHLIRDWSDLRNRLDPEDRRCFAFFHPVMPDEPLIFVEVALTCGIPGNIQQVLASDRPMLAAQDADTAVFYSISNCQAGLKGISFGHFLIKQVAEDLKRALPGLKRFVTLSPVPGFMSWLNRSGDDRLELIAASDWHLAPVASQTRAWLLNRAAAYLAELRDASGRPLDPVARFHLGNGARLEAIHWLADASPSGMRQSAGMMVNYLYDLPSIEQNHELYAEQHKVVTGAPFRRTASEVGLSLPAN